MLRAFAFAALLACTGAFAQNWPTKPVHVMVPFAPGGSADTLGRIVSAKLSETFGQTFVVDNRGGVGGMIGSDQIAKSAPDGYSLLVSSIASQAIGPAMQSHPPYDPIKDFTHIALFGGPPLVFAVNPSLPAKTLKEFIALAKAKPGELNYASSGPGTPYHMAGELFKAMAGVNIVHVPYKGSSGARTDILGVQVQMMFDAITTMAPNVEAGKVRALGTSGKARSSVLPNVPTISEAGVPGYESTIWLGIMAPKGTPRPIIDKLNAEIRKAVNSPDIKAAWEKQGAVGMSMTPEEFERYLHGDIEKWARIVKISGARQDR